MAKNLVICEMRNCDLPRYLVGQCQWLRETIMRKLLGAFLSDESGATAIEYGLIAAGISVAIITVVQGLGTKLTGVFANVSNKLN